MAEKDIRRIKVGKYSVSIIGIKPLVAEMLPKMNHDERADGRAKRGSA